jgi:DNA-binding NarL/FixJ family response regulator
MQMSPSAIPAASAPPVPPASAPGARVLILTPFEKDAYIFGGLRAGASGFLLKRTRPEDLIRAVHTVAAGESRLSPSVTRRVIESMSRYPVPGTRYLRPADRTGPGHTRSTS